MNLMKSTLCFVSMMLLMLATLCPALAESTDDPVVVRVGNVTFTKGQVQSTVDVDVTVSEMMSQAYLTDEERQAKRDEAIQRCIREGLIEMKLRDAGKDDFTDAEEETLRATALSQYEAIWQGLWQQVQQSNQGFTQAQVTEFLQTQGCSSEAIFEALKASERHHRAVELFCPSLTLTEDMVDKYYEVQFIFPDWERYANDLNLYEQEILAGNNESFYTPAGYRAIQQVLLDYPEEVEAALRQENVRVNMAMQVVAGAAQKFSEAALNGDGWDDVAEPRAEYDEAVKALTAAKQAYDEKRARLTMPLIKDTIDEINAAIDAGIDINTIIEVHGWDSPELEAWYTEKKRLEETNPLSGGIGKAFRAWLYSEGNELEMSDYLWEREVPDFVETLRKAGFQSFVYYQFLGAVHKLFSRLR